MNSIFKNKIYILVALSIVNFCNGIMNMWGVFYESVIAYFQVSEKLAAIPMNLSFICYSFGIILGGWFSDRLGNKKPMVMGCCFFAAGVLISSFVGPNSFPLFMALFNIVSCFGGGMLYVTCLNCTQRWWKDRKGFAGGVVLCAIGLSVVVLTPIMRSFILNSGRPFLLALRYYGIIYAVIFALILPTISDAPKESAAGKTGAAGEEGRHSALALLRSPTYYLLLICCTITPVAYLTISPVLTVLGQARALSQSMITLNVMLIGFSNALGRFVCTKLCDDFGSKRMLLAIYIINIVSMVLLIRATGILYFILVIVVSFTYGGNAGMNIMIANDYFDPEIIGSSYGLLMISGILTNLVASASITLFMRDGMLTAPNFLFPAVTCVLAIFLLQIAKKQEY